MRFEPEWTHWEKERTDSLGVGVEEEVSEESLTREKRQTFWSTPEVKTELPSCKQKKMMREMAVCVMLKTYGANGHAQDVCAMCRE